MAYFQKSIGVRLRKEHFEAMTELSDTNPEKYKNITHIVRCAIIQLLEVERRQAEYGKNRRSKAHRQRKRSP